jgi:hypothetical protein
MNSVTGVFQMVLCWTNPTFQIGHAPLLFQKTRCLSSIIEKYLTIFSYKFVSVEGSTILWEDGVRTVHKPQLTTGSCFIMQNDGSFRVKIIF